MKRWKPKNADYRKHAAAHARAMVGPQHDYDGKGPVCHAAQYSHHQRGSVQGCADLIRYASALGRKLGLLPDDLSQHFAVGLRREDGTGYVDFTPGESESMRYGYGWRVNNNGFQPAPNRAPIRVEMRFLDWVPGEPTEELEPERLAA
jgi:hypothetical protein